MTREEAIAELKRYIGSDGTVPEELKMAISALEHHDEFMKRSYEQGKQDALSQEPICDRDCEHCTWTECPIEPCDDAISREAFITRYREWMKSEYGKIPDDDALAIRVIKSLPSVTQKSGKWIYSDLLRVKHGTMNIDALIDKVWAKMESEDKE